MDEDYLNCNVNINFDDDEIEDEDDLLNYKGKYHADEQEEKYFEDGAHFQYVDLYHRLEKLLVKLSPERRGSCERIEDLKNKNQFINSLNTFNVKPIQSSRNNKAENHMILTSKNFTKDFKIKDKYFSNANMNTINKTINQNLNTINVSNNNNPTVIFKKVKPITNKNTLHVNKSGNKILYGKESEKKINNTKINQPDSAKVRSLGKANNLVILNNSNFNKTNFIKEGSKQEKERENLTNKIEKDMNTIIINELNKISSMSKSRNISKTKQLETINKPQAKISSSNVVNSPVPNKNNLIDLKTISSNKSRNTNRTLPDKTEVSNKISSMTNGNTNNDNKTLYSNTNGSMGHKFTSTIKNESKPYLLNSKKKAIQKEKTETKNDKSDNVSKAKNTPQFLTKNTLTMTIHNVITSTQTSSSANKKPNVLEMSNQNTFKTKKITSNANTYSLAKDSYAKLSFIGASLKGNKTNKNNIKYLLLSDSTKKESLNMDNDLDTEKRTINRNNFSPNSKLNSNNLISSTSLSQSQKNENFSNKTIVNTNTNTNTNNYNSSISKIFLFI